MAQHVDYDLEHGGSWAAMYDTEAHEMTHVWFYRHLPRFSALSSHPFYGAIGHARVGRLHAIPFAPLEAHGSLRAILRPSKSKPDAAK